MLGACQAPERTADAALAPHVRAVLGAPVPAPANNPSTPEGIALGKKLFFDPILSANGQVSCATCHQPNRAFSDGQPLSTLGITHRPLSRHTPALINVAWMPALFWDGGARNPESLVFGPLTHVDEMGTDLRHLVQTLQDHPTYPAAFQRAFGSDSITSATVARALAQFTRTLVFADSRYDRWQRQEAGGELTAAEQRGRHLFEQRCAGCHTPGLFTDNRYHNNGLDRDFADTREEGLRQGRYRITFDSADLGRYKTPTLRNVAQTAPYMHDGRLATLDDVLAHYRFGVQPSPTLDALLQQPDGPPGIGLTDEETADLKAFLLTLTEITEAQ
ncbi:cytochrome c peroxidase [Catalinimonas alkaloidigena]|uniref:Methylamine utilization protein MauG n=2 Tax=Catalinimonas alkaloidigena TaxID=1075417 RepID=A0A1G8WBT4_9BACT|nr:cytochrome c peroxidase [Catalinimonas alkaloidigena]